MQRVERHPPVGHIVLAEELTAGEFAQPAGCSVSVVWIEHDSAATGFDLEEACREPRQQQRAEPAVDDVEIGDRGVQTEVIRVGVIPRRDGILGRPVDLDVAALLTAQAADQRPRIASRELGAQISTPPLRRPVILLGLGEVRPVHPPRDRLGVDVGIDNTNTVRLGEHRDRRRRHGGDLVGQLRQLAGQDREVGAQDLLSHREG